jgi:hypothetical protein
LVYWSNQFFWLERVAQSVANPLLVALLLRVTGEFREFSGMLAGDSGKD